MNRLWRTARYVVYCAVVLCTSSLAAEDSAPPDIRYEAGRRLRQFEDNWRQTTDLQARRRAIAPLKQAVNQFLGGKQLAAAESLDRARLALHFAEEPSPQVRWAESLYISFARRLLDAGQPSLTVRLENLYIPAVEIPAEAVLELRVVNSEGQGFLKRHAAITAPICTVDIPLVELGEGDWIARYDILVDEKRLSSGDVRFSLVKELSERLTAATKALDFAAQPDTIDRGSTKALVKLLSGLAGGDHLETDFPGLRLIVEIEQALAAHKAGETFYKAARSGEFWLQLPIKGNVVPVRIFVPECSPPTAACPLVVALHGAGGSENLFFDGYGHGAIVDECRRRGWIVLSPRTSGFGLLPVVELIDALAANYEIDRSRVFLVGHSMGAIQATAAAQADPARYAAIAALGGGGVAKASEAIKRLPYFVAAGSEDFALPGVRRLVSNLQKSGVEKVVFREYPDLEHLLIVQESLPDVFRFFDEASAEVR